MQKLKTIDYITSLAAACLWLLGGVSIFSLVGSIPKHVISIYGQSPKGAPIYTFIGFLLYAGFVVGAWLAVKWLLPFFINMTKQRNLRLTVHRYIIFSWFSIFSLLLADVIAKDNLIVNYGLWVIVLAGIYLLAKLKTAE